MTFSKFRLSVLVVISALSGYLFVGGNDTWELVCLLVGGMLVTSASNGSNQIWERELDILMNRTTKRPLPQNEMTVNEGLAVVSIFLISGLFLLLQISLGVMLLGFASYISYVFIYTPMKRISPWAVFVGAFPGAIPPMLGAVAGSESYGLVPGILFAVQFIWQFPHFWAIAWVANDDYQKAGFYLLPDRNGKTKKSAFQILIYSFMLIPISLLPWLMDWVGSTTFAIVGTCSLLFFMQSYKLYMSLELKDAKKLMFASFIWLPIVQFVYVFDRNQKAIEEALWYLGKLY